VALSLEQQYDLGTNVAAQKRVAMALMNRANIVIRAANQTIADADSTAGEVLNAENDIARARTITLRCTVGDPWLQRWVRVLVVARESDWEDSDGNPVVASDSAIAVRAANEWDTLPGA
jgi:hypothetical protein